MGEFVRARNPDGTVTVAKTTDAMLEEIGRLAHGWQNERDFIRTLCEVHLVGSAENSRDAFAAIIEIVRGVK